MVMHSFDVGQGVYKFAPSKKISSKKIIIHNNRKFGWTMNELAKIQFLWIKGKNPTEIANEIKEDVKDVALVLMDLYFKGEIELFNERSS